MHEYLTDAGAVHSANAFFDQLLLAVDPDEHLSMFQSQVEDYRWEVLNHSRHPATTLQLHGFVCALIVTGALSVDHSFDLTKGLSEGHQAGWL